MGIVFQLTRSRGAWLPMDMLEKYMNNFNSHAHVERDWSVKIKFLLYLKFQLTRSRGAWLTALDFAFNREYSNSHAHVERDRHWELCVWYSSNSNSHAHVERDLLNAGTNVEFINSNSHAHVERDVSEDIRLNPYANSNSHAHVERDVKRAEITSLFHIPTHTLTWSVTSTFQSSGLIGSFQLTRSRGAWRWSGWIRFL